MLGCLRGEIKGFAKNVAQRLTGMFNVTRVALFYRLQISACIRNLEKLLNVILRKCVTSIKNKLQFGLHFHDNLSLNMNFSDMSKTGP